MTKTNIPIFALLIGYAGALANLLADAKSLIGSCAALASLVASLYAIALTRRRLVKLRRIDPNPFRKSVSSAKSAVKPLRTSRAPSRTSRPSRLKNSVARAARAFVLSVALCGFSGCATNAPGDSPLSKLATLPARVLDTAANLVTSTVTNVTEQAVVTTTDTVSRDPLTLILVTNTALQTNVMFLSNITAIARPAITTGINTAETAATFLPPPYGEAAAGALAIVSTLLAAAVRRRNTMLKTVIHGVESSGSEEVKSQIASRAMENGVMPALHTLVKKLTALAFIAGTLAAANAQSFVTEGQNVNLLFDHTEHFAIKAYTNGAIFRSFSLNEVALYASATTNTYRITLPPLPRGTFNLTLTAVDTTGLESDPSGPLVLQVKHRPPGNLRKDK